MTSNSADPRSIPTADGLSECRLVAIRERLATGSVSSRALTDDLLERIAAFDGRLRAFSQVLGESARLAADRADAALAAGASLGALHGVPIAIKDLCAMRGLPTGAGSIGRREAVASEDATVVERLRRAGAVLIGKTQLTEGAHADYHPSIEPVLNPWNPAYWAGISSSGSAVAVAARFCCGAIATDTGGSIRWPAAANGITGLKPTWGRVSRHGVFALAPSLDHVGVMAVDCLDVAVLFDAIAGPDPADPSTALVPPRVGRLEPASNESPSLDGVTLGIDPRWNQDDVSSCNRLMLAEALERFIDLGARIIELDFPDVNPMIRDWGPNCAAEAARVHDAAWRERRSSFGPVLGAVITEGQAVPLATYRRIIDARARFRARLDALFAGVDLVLTPVQPVDPVPLDRIATLGTQPDLIAALQRFTCPFNMSGHPTLTLMAGVGPGAVPMGIQLVAARFDEAALLRAGVAFQSTSDWHRRLPPDLPFDDEFARP